MPVHTTEGLHRLTAFADAVVAIAMTLLILPLADLPSELPHESLGTLLNNNLGLLGSFLLSFVVIGRLWMVHHQMFEPVIGYDRVLMQLTLVWLVTIVFLPFPTELLSNASSRGVSALYIGTLLASSASLSLTHTWLAYHPALLKSESADERIAGKVGWVTSTLLAIAFVVSLINPKAGMWALLLLLLTGPVEKLVTNRAPKRL